MNGTLLERNRKFVCDICGGVFDVNDKLEQLVRTGKFGDGHTHHSKKD